MITIDNTGEIADKLIGHQCPLNKLRQNITVLQGRGIVDLFKIHAIGVLATPKIYYSK